jgi:electron transfer flavoprotein alpha/beta subunit
MIPELEFMSEKDWVSTVANTVDTSFLNKCINSQDESALEIALCLKDKMECKLTGVTIGPDSGFYRNLFALRFDRVVRIETEKELRFQSEIVARALTRSIEMAQEKQDLILLGSQCAEGNNGKTPFLVAEMLGIPCIMEVIEIEHGIMGKTLLVKTLCEDGIMEQEIALPFVAAIGNAPKSFLRMPTLVDKLKTKDCLVEQISMNDLVDDSFWDSYYPNYRLTELDYYNSDRNTVVIKEGDMKQMVGRLRAIMKERGIKWERQ